MSRSRALARNLAAGFRLATLRDVDRGAFCCDASQAVLLAAVAIGLAVASALLRTGVPLDGLRDAATDVATILACGALFAALDARPALRTGIPVVLLSLAPLGTLVAALIHLGWAAALSAGNPTGPWLVASAFYLAWVLLVHYRGIELATGRDARRAVPVYALYLVIGLAAASLVPKPAGEPAPVAHLDGGECAGASCSRES